MTWYLYCEGRKICPLPFSVLLPGLTIKWTLDRLKEAGCSCTTFRHRNNNLWRLDKTKGFVFGVANDCCNKVCSRGFVSLDSLSQDEDASAPRMGRTLSLGGPFPAFRRKWRVRAPLLYTSYFSSNSNTKYRCITVAYFGVACPEPQYILQNDHRSKSS